MPLRAPPLGDSARFGPRNLACQLANPPGGHPRNLRSPLRSFLDPVFALPFQVGAVGGVLGGASGHVSFVEANAIPVQKGLVVQVFLQHYVNHSRHQSGVRARAQGHPLVAKRDRRF